MHKTKFSYILCLLAFLWLGNVAQAQNTRINDHNTVGWYNGFATVHLYKKLSWHGEYQWRRDQLIINWQQALYRTGLTYQLTPMVQVRAGYAFVETYPYGDINLQAAGRYFPEHRTYQMVSMNDTVSKLELNHRFMLEQRWVGRYSMPGLEQVDEFVYTNRMRYMLRLQYAFNKPRVQPGAVYAAAYDEILISFGENVNANIFDQNRLGVMLGYQFNRNLRLEAGAMQQILQLGRLVDNRNVMQYNTGLIVNANYTLDLR